MNIGDGDAGKVDVACARAPVSMRGTDGMLPKRLEKESGGDVNDMKNNDTDVGHKTLEERLEEAVNNLFSVLVELEEQRNPSVVTTTVNTEVEKENSAGTDRDEENCQSVDDDIGLKGQATGKRKRTTEGQIVPRAAPSQPPMMMTKEGVVKAKGFIDRIHTVIEKLGQFISGQVEQMESFFDSASPFLSLGSVLLSKILDYCDEGDLYNCEMASYTLNNVIFDCNFTVWGGKNPYEILASKRKSDLMKILPKHSWVLYPYYYRVSNTSDVVDYLDFREEGKHCYRSATHTTNNCDRMCHNRHDCNKQTSKRSILSHNTGGVGKLHRCTATKIESMEIREAHHFGTFSAAAQQFDILASTGGLFQDIRLSKNGMAKGVCCDETIQTPWRENKDEDSPLDFFSMSRNFTSASDLAEDHRLGIAFLRVSYWPVASEEQGKHPILLWEGFVTVSHKPSRTQYVIALKGDPTMKQTFKQIRGALNGDAEAPFDWPILPHQLRIVVTTHEGDGRNLMLVTQGRTEDETETDDDEDERGISFQSLIASSWEDDTFVNIMGDNPPTIECEYILADDEHDPFDDDEYESYLAIRTNAYAYDDD